MVAGGLSADGWSSRAGVSYFALLLHTILANGKLLTIQLAVFKKTEQSASSLNVEVRRILGEWGFEDCLENPLSGRIRTFTTDTTNVMPAMTRLLGFRWIPCFAHLLNLVVKDGLKVVFGWFLLLLHLELHDLFYISAFAKSSWLNPPV